jgi:hypothetical protein
VHRHGLPPFCELAVIDLARLTAFRFPSKAVPLRGNARVPGVHCEVRTPAAWQAFTKARPWIKLTAPLAYQQ